MVELPNSMSYRYSGVGYDAVLSVDTAQRDSGGAAIPMLYLFDTADEVDEAEAEQYLSKLTAGEFSPLMYESKATVRSEFAQFRQMFLLIGGILCAIIAGGTLKFLQRHDDRYSFPPPGICCASGCRNDAPTAQNHADLRGVVLRNVFRIGGLCAFTGGGTLAGKMLGSMFWFFEYRFTVLPVLLTIPVFLLLGWLIPCMMYDNAAKCSIVDQLRDAQ